LRPTSCRNRLIAALVDGVGVCWRTLPAAPLPGVVIADLTDIPDKGGIVIDLREGDALFSMLVVQTQSGPRAYLNRCPHARWPLETASGDIVLSPGGDIVCAAHGAMFNPETGAFAGGPGRGDGLTPIEITVVGDAVCIA
jgi:nitrite reductase/ring-hydroxylating ferredoxin subunit